MKFLLLILVRNIYTKSVIVNELVLHGGNRSKIIDRKQRNKEQANNELLKHYEEIHSEEIFQDREGNEENEDAEIETD